MYFWSKLKQLFNDPSEIGVLSVNCQGLWDRNKYNDDLNCLKKLNASVSPNTIIIPFLWLKTKEILRLCGTVSKRFYTGPLLLFYQTTQIKATLRTPCVSSSMTKSLK